MTYKIKNKATGSFFGGFGANGLVLWVSKDAAWAADILTAKAQSALLIAVGETAQRKPEAA